MSADRTSVRAGSSRSASAAASAARELVERRGAAAGYGVDSAGGGASCLRPASSTHFW
jgi:hypothetical protein